MDSVDQVMFRFANDNVQEARQGRDRMEAALQLIAEDAEEEGIVIRLARTALAPKGAE